VLKSFFFNSGIWQDLKLYRSPPVVTMLFLGFSSGLPIYLVFSSLSLWLLEAGIDRSTITFFSWAALCYSFKFIWAPLVDSLPIPFLSRWLGRRRSWLLLSQGMVALSMILMALVDPSLGGPSITYMVIGVVALGFSSATQDIIIDVFRIKSAPADQQAALSAMYIVGYRIGMIMGGAGALYLAEQFGSSGQNYHYPAWRNTYLMMSLAMLVGVITVLMRPEPCSQADRNLNYTPSQYTMLFFTFLMMAFVFIFSFLSLGSVSVSILLSVASFFAAIKFSLVDAKLAKEAFIEPIREFVFRYDYKIVILLLALIGTYRISDIVLGVIANIFYSDLGFTKKQIAVVTNVFGLIITLLGGIIGGLLVHRIGVIRMLFWGALLSALSNLLFLLLAKAGNDLMMFYFVIIADNLAGGLATTAFVAFLSSLTAVSFTATQYAIFSSLMTLLPKLIGGYSGTMVNAMEYPNFFLLTTALGLPVIVLVWLTHKMESKIIKKTTK